MKKRSLLLPMLGSLGVALACSGTPTEENLVAGTGGGSNEDGGAPGLGGTAGGDTDGTGGGEAIPTCGTSKLGATEERTRYRTAEVATGETCEKETQTRTCTASGWGDFDGTFAENSCAPISDDGSCGATPNGENEQRTRYQAASVPFGSTCVSESQVRTCTAATWSEFSGTFTAATCTVEAPASCGTVAHGANTERTRYQSATVPFGSTCVSETQSALCTNGTLAPFDGSYAFDACVVGPADDCDGGAHGTSLERIRYEAALVPWNETCNDETQLRTCKNGDWEDWTGTFTEEACAIEEPLDCDGGVHGDTVERTRYATSSVAWNGVCAPETQTRLCQNGAWSEWTGSYSAESCAPVAPADCAGGVHGATSQRIRYAASSVPYGSTCSSEQQSQTCTNGLWSAWSGTFTASSCDALPAANCEGGVHGQDEQRTMYAEASVPSGSTCVSQTQSRSCNNGTWSAWSGTYANSACVVEAPFAGSCALSYQSEKYACNDYTGSLFTPTAAQLGCSGGVYSTAHCSNENKLGVCTMNGGTSSEYKIFYYQSAVYQNAAAAAAQCFNGVFSQ